MTHVHMNPLLGPLCICIFDLDLINFLFYNCWFTPFHPIEDPCLIWRENDNLHTISDHPLSVTGNILTI